VPQLGWFGQDVWDAVTDVTSSVATRGGDATASAAKFVENTARAIPGVNQIISAGGAVVDSAIDVVRAVPGAEDLAGALEDLLEGPLREIASSESGVFILRALAGTVFGPLAWEVGPTLASATFALPGLLRGEDFWHSWFNEVMWRAEKTAEHFGPGAAAGVAAALGPAAELLKKILPEGIDALSVKEIAQRLGVDSSLPLDQLSKRFGVSEWVASMVRSAIDPVRFPVIPAKRFDQVGNLQWNLTQLPSGTTHSQAKGVLDVATSAVRKYMGLPPPSTAMVATTATAMTAPETMAEQVGSAALVLVASAGVAVGLWVYLDRRRR
jgi:hypothetical protein